MSRPRRNEQRRAPPGHRAILPRTQNALSARTWRPPQFWAALAMATLVPPNFFTIFDQVDDFMSNLGKTTSRPRAHVVMLYPPVFCLCVATAPAPHHTRNFVSGLWQVFARASSLGRSFYLLLREVGRCVMFGVRNFR